MECRVLSRAVTLFAIGQLIKPRIIIVWWSDHYWKYSVNSLFMILCILCTGAMLSMALDLLLVDRGFQPWWLVPVSGVGAVCVGEETHWLCNDLVCVIISLAPHKGLLYPFFVSESAADAPDGAKVIRCVAVFVGIYQASNVSYLNNGLKLDINILK